MTIAERKAREERDKENPWRPMETAKPGGLMCDLLFNHLAGHFHTEGMYYFLDVDGTWYCTGNVEPAFAVGKPIAWRPAYVVLTPERRSLIKRRWKERLKP